jgi:rSAM/selenodomain-associated transferase 1
MRKTVIIVFVKNIRLGKVKTRLAKTVGEEVALQIYKKLIQITEGAIKDSNFDSRVYFSDSIIDGKFDSSSPYIQKGENLGDKMWNAFREAFEDCYEQVVLIGSDLPEITESIIEAGIDQLKTKDIVLGPSEDGGYYLIGMREPFKFLFDNKPWSESHLYKETEEEIFKNKKTLGEIVKLNDVDTYEDYIKSSIYDKDFLEGFSSESKKTEHP